MATPTQALALLRQHPRRFLRNYHLMVVRAVGVSGQTAYNFGAQGIVDLQGRTIYDRTPRPGRYLGTWRMHNSKNFIFTPHAGAIVGASLNVQVWHVDVSPSHTIALGAIPSLPVSRNAGPDIVVTTLLNGCSFVCEPDANDVLMAHVQPTGGITAGALETGILNTGILVGGGGAVVQTVFGGARCYTAMNDDVTIVGVRRAQQWQMFAQIHPRGQRQVTQVSQFFQG
jgi:hypothetical protein